MKGTVLTLSQRPLLFIGHDAHRTGAPIVFLHFLKWVKEHTRTTFHILLKNGGELEPEFASLGPVSLFHPHTALHPGIGSLLFSHPVFGQMLTRVYLKFQKERLTHKEFGGIYLNTTATAEILGLLDKIRCPVICHVHELDCWIQYQIGVEQFNRIKQRTTHYIAVSQAVKRSLIEQYGIAEEKIDVIHESIPTRTSQFQKSTESQMVRHRICQQLQIPEQAMIVCGSGTTDWRKGPDLFIQLARTVHVRYRHPSIYFIWVGGDCRGIQFGQLQHDVHHLDLELYIRFLGSQTTPLSFFAASDVFVLTSREDPFPLVCLEAASLGKPIICFDKAGGMPEFVENDAGVIVPYLDLDAMATHIVELLNSPDLRQRLGQRAQQKVQEHYDIEMTAPQIFRIIQQTFSGNDAL